MKLLNIKVCIAFRFQFKLVLCYDALLRKAVFSLLRRIFSIKFHN